jgi:hypothetical protein
MDQDGGNEASPMDAALVVPTTVSMRRMLVVAGVFVVIAGFQLFVLSERTADFFAWTVEPPLTAAFLGAGYWSSAVLELGSARRREWCRARCAMPTVLLFTAITLVVTLVHIDRFHMDSVFGIAWLCVYCAFPVAMTAVLVAQLRVRGVDLPRGKPLAAWARGVLALQAVVLAPFGTLLLLATSTAAEWWPWPLTPLTARAVGAWLVGMAALAVQIVAERSVERVDVALGAWALFGVLQLLALARYSDVPDWNAAGAVAYIGFCVTSVVVGAYGVAAARQATRRVGNVARAS